jgi:hypothetical protein
VSAVWQHSTLSRRCALQAGAVGLLGLGTNHLQALRAEAKSPVAHTPGSPKSVIYIFLSGGLAQHDSFDPKPDAPEGIRGEFAPIATGTPGVHICEHLPRLAARSHLWSLIRSFTHPSNDHSGGHHIMLTGRSQLPPTFSPNEPRPGDWPSIASMAGALTTARNNLPPAIVLPERLIHRQGRVIPGQFAGIMGSRRDPWFIEAAPFNGITYGAYPEYEFHHARGGERQPGLKFQAPSLSLPETLPQQRVLSRWELLRTIDEQRNELDRVASTETFDRYRQDAVSLLTDPQVRSAFDVTAAVPEIQDRYGRNSFGWSLLMAKRLVQAGVNLVQVNLGNNEAWDTHGNAFPNLKDFLLPPMDRGVSALLDDLHAEGLLDSTLIVMAGEFGRTPKISTLPQHYRLSGRDHWGAVQTVFLAGGGTAGGRVIGSSDKNGGYPADNPQTPENLAATIYSTLGLPSELMWTDELQRPHHVYYGDPIRGLA